MAEACQRRREDMMGSRNGNLICSPSCHLAILFSSSVAFSSCLHLSPVPHILYVRMDSLGLLQAEAGGRTDRYRLLWRRRILRRRLPCRRTLSRHLSLAGARDVACLSCLPRTHLLPFRAFPSGGHYLPFSYRWFAAERTRVNLRRLGRAQRRALFTAVVRVRTYLSVGGDGTRATTPNKTARRRAADA